MTTIDGKRMWDGFGPVIGQQLIEYRKMRDRKPHVPLTADELAAIKAGEYIERKKNGRITTKGRDAIRECEDAVREDIARESREAGITDGGRIIRPAPGS